MTTYRYNFDAICQLCGDLYVSHGTGRIVCYKCEENIDFVNRYTCSGCGGYFPNIKLSPNGMCSKCQRILVSNRVVTKKCKACQEQFHCFSSKTNYCNSCANSLDFITQNTCSICKYFDPYAEREYDQNHRGYACGCVENFHKDFNKRKKIEHSQLGKCKNPNCETPNELTYDRNPINGYCKNCSSKVTQSYMKSNLNGGLCKNKDCSTPERINSFLHPVNGYCKDCMIEVNYKTMQNKIKDGLCKCKTCKHKDRINEVLNPITGYCSDCLAENLPENFKAIPNFIGINDINNTPYEYEICNNHQCEILYYDKNKSKYVCWECYKELFCCKEESTIEGFELIPTFITNNSNRTNIAFDRYLTEKNVGYFVYIKFYTDEYGASRPLVVGKTGSTLVNSTGDDVLFDYKDSSGPARRFLNEKSYKWNKKTIEIHPCNTEKEALDLEKEIQRKYNLFSN